MSSAGAAPRAAVPAINARAEASRRNGAKSRGPKTPEGKARSAQNALKHGFRAQKHVVLYDEDAAEFAALEAALLEELAPQGALQSVLARRLAAAAWRLSRADRMESELLGRERRGDADLARALVRDGHGARVFPTLLRYRGAAMAELMRSLRALKALQAEARAAAVAPPRAREFRTNPRAAQILANRANRAKPAIERTRSRRAGTTRAWACPRPGRCPIEPRRTPGRSNPSSSSPAAYAPQRPSLSPLRPPSPIFGLILVLLEQGGKRVQERGVEPVARPRAEPGYSGRRVAQLRAEGGHREGRDQ
jgi:hypothetical protein